MWSLKQLNTFYWVAKLESFTAAAEKLYSTQSTISMRIQDLEEHVGVVLFDRSHRRIRLTPKGEEFLKYAEKMIQLTNEVQQRIAGEEVVSGFLRLGVAEVIAQTWLPQFVKELHNRYPNVAVEFEVALTEELFTKLRNGTLDLVFAPGRISEFEFTGQSLGHLDFEWMANPDLELPRRTLGPADLQDWPIITLSRDSHHHVTIERWFKDHNAQCKRLDICNSLDIVAALTKAGLGVSFLPPSCYQTEIEREELYIVDTEPTTLPVEFFAIRSDNDDHHDVAKCLSDLASEVSTFDRSHCEPPAH